MTKILFLHGWHSVPGGVKPSYLKDHSYEVINPALNDDDFEIAVATAQGEFNMHQPQVVVGSSRGGATAMNINSGDAKLVLLCPAWKNWGTARTVKSNTVILHSRADDVIPFADSEELALNSRATLIEVGNDHRLADPEPLAAILKACVPLAEVNSIIELHDSSVGGIDSIRGSCVIRFRPAYIHRSAGRPGFDRGTGWVQDVDIVLENVSTRVGFSEFPCRLSDGSCLIDGVVYENEIPFPVDAFGDIRVSFENQSGQKLGINASRITLNPVGNATYVEEFPGSA